MIRVLIADDHPLLRRGMAQVLGATGEIEVVAEADSAEAALQALAKAEVDVAVLDVNMPGRSGLEIVPEIRELYPRTAILILSQYPEEQLAVRAIRAGASGYLTKESAPDLLISAVTKLAQGRRYLSENVADLLATRVSSSGGQPHETLSDREYQVLCLIASGRGVTEIGAQLNLSPKTVSTYRARILEKMGLESNAELTRYALQNRLVD